MVLTDAERMRRYRERVRGGPPRELQPHGTPAAYKRHIRNREAPCAECKAVESQRQHRMYLARKARQQEKVSATA